MKSIIVNNLTKTYGRGKEKVLAVDDVSFDVNPGEIFGLIGPDGAGKTSIFRMLTTVLLPDSGSALIEGNSEDFGLHAWTIFTLSGFND